MTDLHLSMTHSHMVSDMVMIVSHNMYDNHKLESCHSLQCARRGLDKNIVSTTAPEHAVLSVMSLGVALRTDESGASEAAETFIFLASI